ncbi:MAG TPA: DUF4097 family beta strand repeat-containing protein [Actinomycetota bacterium]
MTTYPTPEPIAIDVRIPAGTIEIDTVEGAETTVDVRRLRGPRAGETPQEVREIFRPSSGGRATLYVAVEQGRRRWSGRESYEVRITTPHGPSVATATGSAKVTGRGRFHSLDVKTASGNVVFGDVEADARVQSASGDVELGDVGGSASIATVSGQARASHVGAKLSASMVSGSISVERADGDVSAKSVSGSASVGAVDRGRVDLSTVSGNLDVGVVADRGVWMDLVSASGDTSCELDGFGEGQHRARAADVEIHARSVSGDIRVHRAIASAGAA